MQFFRYGLSLAEPVFWFSHLFPQLAEKFPLG